MSPSIRSQSKSILFESLRATLNWDLILKYPDFTKDFIINTNSINLAVGAKLAQLDKKDQDHPVFYAPVYWTNMNAISP